MPNEETGILDIMQETEPQAAAPVTEEPRDVMAEAIYIGFLLTAMYRPDWNEKAVQDFCKKHTTSEQVIVKAIAIWAIVIREAKRRKEGEKKND